MSRKHLITAFTSDAEDRISLYYGHCSMGDSGKLILILFSSIENHRQFLCLPKVLVFAETYVIMALPSLTNRIKSRQKPQIHFRSTDSHSPYCNKHRLLRVTSWCIKSPVRLFYFQSRVSTVTRSGNNRLRGTVQKKRESLKFNGLVLNE
jgi:hypothetical protein